MVLTGFSLYVGTGGLETVRAHVLSASRLPPLMLSKPGIALVIHYIVVASLKKALKLQIKHLSIQ